MSDPIENGPRALRRWASPMGLAAATLTVLAVGWMVTEMRSLRGELDQIHLQQQEASDYRQILETRRRELENQLEGQQTETATLQRQLTEREERLAGLEAAAASRAPKPRPLVASIVLSVVRAEPPTLELPAAAEFVELYVGLEGDDDYPSFRATLTTATGGYLWTGTDLRVRVTEWGSEAVARLPAKLLGVGGYQLALEGRDTSGDIHALGSHNFNVIR